MPVAKCIREIQTTVTSELRPVLIQESPVKRHCTLRDHLERIRVVRWRGREPPPQSAASELRLGSARYGTEVLDGPIDLSHLAGTQGEQQTDRE